MEGRSVDWHYDSSFMTLDQRNAHIDSGLILLFTEAIVVLYAKHKLPDSHKGVIRITLPFLQMLNDALVIFFAGPTLHQT